MEYLLVIDQGTTSSRALIFTLDGDVAAVSQREFAQHFPQPAWVEHDPEEIWESVTCVVSEALMKLKAKDTRATILGVGITNQRETAVIWDRGTGEPIHNAIVWQDRRTTEKCEALKSAGAEPEISARTGLKLDPYFSATKFAWLLDHAPGARAKANAGKLCAGTIDSFLIWRLTGGEMHATDATNASRTSLYNIDTGEWDETLLKLFDVPAAIMPEVRDCVSDFGRVSADLIPEAPKILGVAGDQQAASIGQGCVKPGRLKSTYGTGCFMLANTGATRRDSQKGLLTTIGFRLNNETAYALEGAIFSAGSIIQWMRDQLGIVADAAKSEAMAKSVADNAGVILVPAFNGLGAPYWAPSARAAIFGMTRGVTDAHIVRAGLEAIAYQSRDLIEAFEDAGATCEALNVDGGMAANNWCMQFLADILDTRVIRPKNVEATAVGAACLAALGAGRISSLENADAFRAVDQTFTPSMSAENRSALVDLWRDAVGRTLA